MRMFSFIILTLIATNSFAQVQLSAQILKNLPIIAFHQMNRYKSIEFPRAHYDIKEITFEQIQYTSGIDNNSGICKFRFTIVPTSLISLDPHDNRPVSINGKTQFNGKIQFPNHQDYCTVEGKMDLISNKIELTSLNNDCNMNVKLNIDGW